MSVTVEMADKLRLRMKEYEVYFKHSEKEDDFDNQATNAYINLAKQISACEEDQNTSQVDADEVKARIKKVLKDEYGV